jgi:hypothetical protein
LHGASLLGVSNAVTERLKAEQATNRMWSRLNVVHRFNDLAPESGLSSGKGKLVI